VLNHSELLPRHPNNLEKIEKYILDLLEKTGKKQENREVKSPSTTLSAPIIQPFHSLE
jgi:hypothetical protein